MPKVDSKGRIVLPQELRERLGIAPGSEVEVREEGGRVVVEPEDDPAEVIARMEALVAGIPDGDRSPTPYDDLDPQSRDHVDAIRRQARAAESDDADE
ncbi:MAG: AbrB/MazE/SpoVT family DNA-binding domain-containing protein [Haloferacaceae archaeon]